MIEVVDTKLLENVAGKMPSAPKKESRSSFNGGQGAFDLEGWIESHEIQVRREGDWNGTGYKWVLEECPWNGHTDNAAFIVRWPNGTIGAGCHHNSCQGYGWRDLREHFEPGCYEKEESNRYADGRGDDYSSHFISDGRTSLSEVPRFPTEVLPRTLRRFVEEAAASIGCPPEFIAVPMLATLGSAIGNSRVLEVKANYTESAALYSAIIGDPGSSKTPALKLATAPAINKQEELGREYREALAEYNRESRRWERNDFVTDPPQEPVNWRTVVQDTTVEALMERLAENLKGLLSNNDELSGWVRSMDQYKGGNKGNDRQFWLSTWSSTSVSVDRKGRKGPLMVTHPFVCIAGGIQPGILSEIKNNREDGLLDRFLFAYPDHTPTRWSDSEVSSETMAAYKRIYEELYGLAMDTDENGVPNPRHATFTTEAKRIFVDAYNSLCQEMEQPGFPGHLKGPWSKMRAYLARISLIIGMAKIAELTSRRKGDLFDFMKTEPMIGKRYVQAAVTLVEYFKAHARRVFAKLHNHQKSTTNEKSTSNADRGADLAQYLVRFLQDREGYWEGMTSELYAICRRDSVPRLPGGDGPFGKQVRKIANDPGSNLIFNEGWRGKEPIIKLSLSTVGTVGNAEHNRTETTEGTEGRNEDEKATANHPDQDVDERYPLAEIKDAIERLFEEHPESIAEPDPEAIAVELFWWGYLEYIPDEGDVESALDNQLIAGQESKK
jgi:hypothetical protein